MRSFSSPATAIASGPGDGSAMSRAASMSDGRLPPRPDAIDRMIARDRHQPRDRAEIRNGETIGLRPDLDEDLLQRLLGLRPIIQDTQADAEKFRAGLPVEQIERRPVLHRGADDQLGDVLRRHRPPN